MRLLTSDLLVERFGGRMRAVAPGIEFIRLRGDRTFDGDVRTADVVCLSSDLFYRDLYRTLFEELPNLMGMRWFHIFAAGLDHPVFRSMAERGVTVTNSAGFNAVPIAQYVLAMMLRHAKRIPAWEAAQRERAWQRIDSDELTGATVALVGLGSIGGEVARLARAFGMRVVAVRRRPEPDGLVDALYHAAQLHRMLAEADYVVIAAPLTPETAGLIDATAFAVMKPSAYLINVARGPIVDEAALIDALRDGRIAGAALDVFATEPLPSESPLWAMENVIVTPHGSASSPRTLDRGALIFVDNLRRYATGEPLLNVADFGLATYAEPASGAG
ncbi:MAG: D-2-hydroxyacid dehydrogenase [Dehalococcoidia bacterium]